MSKKKYAISKARILQISNDISEEMCEASREELIEVVKFFRDQYDEFFQKQRAHKDKIAIELFKLNKNFLKYILFL